MAQVLVRKKVSTGPYFSNVCDEDKEFSDLRLIVVADWIL